MKRPLTTQEVAMILGVAKPTLRSWRRRGQGPPYIQPAGDGTTIMYDPAGVEKFKRDRERRTSNANLHS